jgi:leader peptidase (prepilin peptidase) / N-methyltransferase
MTDALTPVLTTLLTTLLPAALIAAVVGLVARPVLRRLPEPDPADVPVDESKTPYAALADRRFALGATLTALAFGVTSWTLLAPAAQPPWVVLASVGTLLALIDLRTTWLPLRLTRLGWLLMALALGLAAVLSNDLQPLLGGFLGATAAAALYWLVWAISRGGFGYGDVRFAPLVGAAAGSVSWSTLAWGLLLGTVAGGVVGIARLVRRQRGAFPYAPSMLLGCYLALAGLALT